MYINVRIIKGKGRGKSVLGYATANAITKDQKMFGNEGSWVTLVNTKYNAVCGISKKGEDWVLETHILDFNEDLYDKDIYIDFKYKIRDLIIFKSLKESKAQLEKDIQFVRDYKSCDECKFCIHRDYGYSNYTVEGTNISCLVNQFEEFEESYNGNYVLGKATTCSFFSKGEYWSIDVDGEADEPTEDWIKSELRDVKIRNLINE